MPAPRLPFDPIERAGDHWEEHFGDATSMRLATSVMRVQQLMIGALDGALKPFALTFSRYEVLVLLLFSKRGSLPLSKIGERLMVHPTSVTSAIDRLEAQGFVERVADEEDRRRTLARLTPAGRSTVRKATKAVAAIDFAITGLDDGQQAETYDLLRNVRKASGDFPD
ncbi:MarR family transcriptional regulator [Nocardioides sp. Root190]|uniref:MarR family winged helix-turn-helix transcriptional regulator n=1 Tax=Nocardioides sp. Root190 TaxID=1736488 RepID=UPI0006FC939C|nr:MarR family transcriptional regulator [Nocardioides sp. Root190]KRB78559.1 MarR family transcriptional regulator [Nocardioides sp. Root190]